MEGKSKYEVRNSAQGVEWHCLHCGDTIILGRVYSGILKVELASGGVVSIRGGPVYVSCPDCGKERVWDLCDDDLPRFVRDRIIKNRAVAASLNRILREIG